MGWIAQNKKKIKKIKEEERRLEGRQEEPNDMETDSSFSSREDYNSQENIREHQRTPEKEELPS